MLKIQNLSIGYNMRSPIIENINFNIGKGELVTILGRNGTGKTTLLKTITGFLKPINGHVLIQDEDITTLKTTALALKLSIVISMICQEINNEFSNNFINSNNAIYQIYSNLKLQ